MEGDLSGVPRRAVAPLSTEQREEGDLGDRRGRLCHLSFVEAGLWAVSEKILYQALQGQQPKIHAFVPS